MEIKRLIFTFFYLILTVASDEDDNVYLRIEQGLLRGKKMISRNGRQFYGFLKIPYAEPPLGQLRFKAPQDPPNWEGVRDATQDGVICTQRNIYVKSRFYLSGEEDCLYLNVYTPQVNNTEKSQLPVMVFFHGGGWVTGSGNSKYYPPHYLLDKDVVFVALNYRLGPMGFISMEDSELPGNWGLKDQNKALQWIQKNIKKFGGDPDLVTIFGESAGGSSVHYHMISPMSKGLFHRGISQSGTTLCSWSLGHPGATRNNTIKLAELLQCPTSPTKALVNCLQQKPASDIILQDVQFMEWYRDPMIPFKPVVEKLAEEGQAFLPEHPEDAIANGKVAPVPWMTGLNSGDGALRVAAIYDDQKLVEDLNKNFNEIVPMSLFFRESMTDVMEISKEIRNFYLGNNQVGNDTIEKVVDIWTDGWFLSGADEAVKLMSKHGSAPVYYYYFSYRGSASFSSVFGDPSRDFGVCHADELIYLFPMEQLFPAKEFTESDKKYMNVFLELWTNFAVTGEPTPPGTKTVNETWKPVMSSNLEYLHLAEDKIIMEENLLEERTRFWSDLKNEKKRPVRDEL